MSDLPDELLIAHNLYVCLLTFPTYALESLARGDKAAIGAVRLYAAAVAAERSWQDETPSVN